MRIMEPGGNFTARLKSHRTRCPLRLRLKHPKAVTAHHHRAFRALAQSWAHHNLPRFSPQYASCSCSCVAHIFQMHLQGAELAVGLSLMCESGYALLADLHIH